MKVYSYIAHIVFAVEVFDFCCTFNKTNFWIMRNCILALTLLISPMAMFAQHNNKIIFDEMANQNILYGEVNPEDFQNELFGLWYNQGFESYQPNADVVDQIKPLLKNVAFELIVATWCPDSKRETPRFLKLLNQLNVPNDELNMIAVNRKKVCPEAGVEEGYIDYIPTFIIRRNEAEIGRIVERPIKTLEGDLLSILKKE